MPTPREDAARYVVYVTKGLADVVVSEIRALAPGITVGQPADRFALVVADAANVARLLATGRTFNDVRLLVAGPAAIRDEPSFDRLCAQAAAATREYLGARDQARAGGRWSVTMSARTPVWRRQPGWDPANVIAARLARADLTARTRADVDLRIQVDGAQAHISVNLPAPLRASREPRPVRPGALRPSVAAALVRLARCAADPLAAEHGIYDPCCGTGTIPAEALRLALPVYASDIDVDAVAATAERLAALAPPGRSGPLVRVFRHDLLRGGPRDVPARMVASNLPWGKQAPLPRRTELFEAVAALVARCVADGGASALLTTADEQLIARIRRHAPGARTTTRRIGLLGQTPVIVVTQPALSKRTRPE